LPLDHYVSQVHLNKFASPALSSRRLHAVRKSDGLKFHCSPKDVCRTLDGSTNEYLLEPRLIEEFLKEVEPRYTEAVDAVRAGQPDAQAIFVITGFAAYVATCSPTAMRLHTAPLEGVLNATAEILDAQGEFSAPPPSLSGHSMTELLRRGTIKFDVDPKYPQAIGIAQIARRVATWGNSDWQVFVSNGDTSPFMTSDFPAGVDKTHDPRVMARVVPLAPDVAVRIIPDLYRSQSSDLSFPKFRFVMVRATQSQVSALNRLIVRNAEDIVFFRDDEDWVKRFIAKNASYSVASMVDNFDTDDGTLTLSRIRVRERKGA
jgi:hypothetical protein